MKILASEWYESKREVWRTLKDYYTLLTRDNQWGYMDEFASLYLHYENDLGGTLGFVNARNEHGGPIRRLYLVCSGRSWTAEEISELKVGTKSIKDFDEDNIL